jgi:hypothetical protein
MSRLVNVGNVKVNAQSRPTINNTVAASVVATTYVYKDAPPLSATQKGKRPTAGATQ